MLGAPDSWPATGGVAAQKTSVFRVCVWSSRGDAAGQQPGRSLLGCTGAGSNRARSARVTLQLQGREGPLRPERAIRHLRPHPVDVARAGIARLAPDSTPRLSSCLRPGDSDSPRRSTIGRPRSYQLCAKHRQSVYGVWRGLRQHNGKDSRKGGRGRFVRTAPVPTGSLCRLVAGVGRFEAIEANSGSSTVRTRPDPRPRLSARRFSGIHFWERGRSRGQRRFAGFLTR